MLIVRMFQFNQKRRVFRNRVKALRFHLIHSVSIIIFLILTLPLAAQQAQDGSIISVTVNPEVLLPDTPFTLTFLLNYPAPENVSIAPPPFPPQLIMDRMVKYPLSSGIFATQIYTVIEYRLIASASGIINLESFTIMTPEGTVETGAYNLFIRSPAPVQRFITPALYWEAPLTAITAGDRVSLTLRANGWNSAQPPASFFMPDVPQEVILSSQSVSSPERQSGIILKLLLIPLREGNFILPSRTLEYENIRFIIPELNLRITRRN